MQKTIKYALCKLFSPTLISLLFLIIYVFSINIHAQNENLNFINFENDSDFDYFIAGNNDGLDPNKGYGPGPSRKSLKLSDANCVEPSWIKAYISGSGNLNFKVINENNFANFFELNIYVDEKMIKSIKCDQLDDWCALDSPIRIHNLDDNSHELKLELKYNSSSSECNSWYPRLTLWLDDIITTSSLKFIKDVDCPSRIKEGDINATIIETIKRCDEIQIEKGTNLQYILNIIESVQKLEDLPKKILILEGGEYSGPLKISNLKKITIKNNDPEEVVFSGQNSSIELLNSSEISVIGLNFGKSEDEAMLIKDSDGCMIENNKIKGFNSSGIKLINCTLNNIFSNILQSNQETVDGICLLNSTLNHIKGNFIYVDNFCYVLVNKSYDNTIIHVDYGDEHIIMDHQLIFAVRDRIFSKDGVTVFDPNQESLNKWGVA